VHTVENYKHSCNRFLKCIICDCKVGRKEEEGLYFREGGYVFTWRVILGTLIRRKGLRNTRCSLPRSIETNESFIEAPSLSHEYPPREILFGLALRSETRVSKVLRLEGAKNFIKLLHVEFISIFTLQTIIEKIL